MTQPTQPPNSERRDFFKKAAAAVIGAVVGVFPALAGLTVILDPLRRKTSASGFVRVTSLAALPNDGVPRRFSVLSDRTDAWNKFPETPIGAVYLRRTGEKTAAALNVVCPHAGCFVDFVAARRGYFCPCHNSAFGLDGKITDPKSPSPRAMDTLEVEIRNGMEIWVRFQNFDAGKKEKHPVA
ncbi:MAG: Rieske (2Fe-2S) protein [Verrucomicrobia bacterium]|nr:Rieske (2Fe-2S) protein [Verrucomicrobiota bacterium]